ncbi:MAG: DUF4136 domain-containing protein [Chlorobiaceae bacterium]|nr:DUF4136 domain-containing protein [Chlorobiaceae bacterium]
MLRILLLSLFTLVLSGCSTLSVTSDYDSSVDFSAYHSYRWSEAPDSTDRRNLLSSNPLIYRRVKRSVDRSLAARGYLLKENGHADFAISARARVMERLRIDPLPPLYGRPELSRGRYGWYSTPWWGSGYAYPPAASFYEEGTLLLDITDTASNELAWRGVVRGVVHEYLSIEKMQTDIDEAVKKLLDEFPPLRK